MLRSLLLLAALGLALTPTSSAQTRAGDAPRPSPNARVGQTFGLTDVDITYGRPATRDRSLFASGSDLAPYGEMWRAGANEATTITFSTDVLVEGQPLAAGTYALFVKPEASDWTVYFNREANQWGAFGYDAERDAARVTVAPETSAEMVEQMQFRIADASNEGATIYLEWGTTRLPIEVTADFARALTDRANAADTWQSLMTYAMIASQNSMDPEVTLPWIERAVAMDGNFNTHRAHAMILANYGDYEGAVAAADLALGMIDDVSEQNVNRLTASREQWMAALEN